MEIYLRETFWQFIVEHNPELMFSLQEDYSVMSYLDCKMASIQPMLEGLKMSGQPRYAIIDQCMETLTEDLKPSRYEYIKALLEKDFAKQAEELRENGTMTFELVGMIEAFQSVFEQFNFNEANEEDPRLAYAIIGLIDAYLKEGRMMDLEGQL